MARQNRWYAISSDHQEMRESKYPPYKLMAQKWEIVAGPFDTFQQAQAHGYAAIGQRAKTDTQAATLQANLKIIQQGKLGAYHIPKNEVPK